MHLVEQTFLHCIIKYSKYNVCMVYTYFIGSGVLLTGDEGGEAIGDRIGEGVGQGEGEGERDGEEELK